MKTAADADLKFDGYVQVPEGPRLPCDIQVLLPKSPAEEAIISVFLNGPAEAVMRQRYVTITSHERVEALGLKFLAEDVFIRASRAQLGFRGEGSQLTITHVGRWVIHRALPRFEGAAGFNFFQVSLSALRYGAQRFSSTASHLGTREIETYGPPKRLRFNMEASPTLTWELQKHWNWKSDKEGESISAHATPVLVLTNASLLSSAHLPRLRTAVDDTCLFLTLAARHRTSPHVLSYHAEEGQFEEWLHPLERMRSQTEEEASGPLIATDELEAYFDRASMWWAPLDDSRKDAVRLAVFAIHGSTERTIETVLMSRFAALEGLATRWGSGRHAADKFNGMVKLFPPASDGLWPVYGKDGGTRLYWFRNEIAHGRTVRFSDGLSLAADHMQLWLERVLLALMGYRRIDQSDLLSQQVFDEQAEISRLRMELAARKGTAAGAPAED